MAVIPNFQVMTSQLVHSRGPILSIVTSRGQQNILNFRKADFLTLANGNTVCEWSHSVAIILWIISFALSTQYILTFLSTVQLISNLMLASA